MATEVTLPQLGESITEGTITSWLVSVGDHVESDQPLFELSSDKIDTEVPAPASGVVTDIKFGVDETVEVGTVVAVIGGEDEAADAGGQAATQQEPAEAAEPAEASETAEPAGQAPAAESEQPAAAEPASASAAQPAPAEAPAAPAADREPSGDGQAAPPLASPLVRRIAAEKGIDPSTVRGTGEGGRVTREDIEAAAGESTREPAPAQPSTEPAPSGRSAQPEARDTRGAASPAASEDRAHTEDLSRIRQRIASKMMESLQSSAQLTTVQEVDVTSIMNTRARVKDTFREREGVSLSPFVFLCRAAVIAIRSHPKINAYADWEAGKVTYHDYVNLGLAVDTEKGLIVPNIKGADDLSLAGMARAIKEAADKARGKGKLEMDDIQGGTFTMTNTGSVGVLIDTPILNYPEVAILGTGAIRKQPTVMEVDGSDTIAIRHQMYLSLTYDHRLIDGADAARFVGEVKQVVETTDWDAEIGY